MKAGGRGRGRLGEIVDAPNDFVFGMDRTGRRLMTLEKGGDIRRDLERPIEFESDESLFISILLRRHPSQTDQGQSLQLSLEPDLPGRGRRLHQTVSFGITTDGFPFINSGNKITKTASRVIADETVFCVLKLAVSGESTEPSLRVYRNSEIIDSIEPTSWTVVGDSGSTAHVPTSLRIVAGEAAAWELDELRLGTSWDSVSGNH